MVYMACKDIVIGQNIETLVSKLSFFLAHGEKLHEQVVCQSLETPPPPPQQQPILKWCKM